MNIIDNIVSALAKLKDGYGELLGLVSQMQRAIVENDPDTVTALTKSQWSLLGHLEVLESDRVKLIVDNGLPDDLEKLMDMAELDQRIRLKVISKELGRIIKEVNDTNELNKSLLQLHFTYINYMLETLTQPPPVSNIYGVGGAVDQAPTSLGLKDYEV